MTQSGRTLIALLLVFIAPALRAQTTANPDDGLELRFANGIAAVVEDRIITVDDIRRELAPVINQIRRDSRNEQEFRTRLERAQDDIVRALVDRILIVREFRSDERRRIPASFVDNALNEQLLERFNGNRADLLAFLRMRGLTMREFRQEIEDDIIYGYMLSQQRRSQSVVSPARVEAYYAKNRDSFVIEDQAHLRLIELRRTEGQSDAELLAAAQVIVNRFEQGESFADLARELSQDARRSRGGDWGWQKRDDLMGAFSEALFRLSKGELAPPIIQPQGVYLLYAEDRKYAGIPPIEDVRDQIEAILAQEMARESQERWLQRLRRNAYVKLY